MRIITTVLVLMTCGLAMVSAEIQVPEGVEITDTNLWTPFVEVLRVRETPDLNGKVVATINLGEQVEYAGETSANQSTVDFNGEKITDSWIKVKLPDGKTGWAWKGFMVSLKKYASKYMQLVYYYPSEILKPQVYSYDGGPSAFRPFKDHNINGKPKKTSLVSYYMRPTFSIEEDRVFGVSMKLDQESCLYVELSLDSYFDLFYPYIMFRIIQNEVVKKELFSVTLVNKEINLLCLKYKKIESTANNGKGYFLWQGNDEELSRIWRFLYSKKYKPKEVLLATWLGSGKNDVKDQFLEDLNSYKCSYKITRWYFSAIIMFQSVIF